MLWCGFGGSKNAREKVSRLSGSVGRRAMYLKEGNRYADVVFVVFGEGVGDGCNDEFVIKILWYG